jgi:AraC-like DNA-binding protein
VESPPSQVGRGFHPGLQPFSFVGNSGSTQSREMQEFAARGPLKPHLVPIAPSAALTGRRLGGAASSAYVSRSVGVLARSPGAAAKPTTLHVSNIGMDSAATSSQLWIRSDATPYEVAFTERHQVVSVTVPIASLAFDLTQFTPASGSVIEAPPIALHALRSLTEIDTADANDWVSASPEAIDRYLVGVTSLIVSAILDDRPDEYVEQDRTWLRTRARALIDTQYYDPALAPATIAARFGVSLRSLHRAFEGEIGVAEELRLRRIAHAAALLSETYCRHLSISDVARRSGFASLATFERSFNQAFETSPHRYRALSLPG